MSMSPDQNLDTAATARAPQATDPQEEYFGMLVAALRNHIFGKGEQGIVRAASEADDVGRVVGEMVYVMVAEAIHQLEAKGVKDLDYDMVLGVATEAIDDIAELLEASGVLFDQQAREYALLYAQDLYVQNQNPSDDQRKAAAQDLAALKQDGAVDQATTYVQKVGMENGTDPFDVAGMSPNTDNPKAAGRALMGGG